MAYNKALTKEEGERLPGDRDETNLLIFDSNNEKLYDSGKEDGKVFIDCKFLE